jgi:hypothetical protein
MTRTSSASPARTFKPDFGKQSAKQDVVDKIYENDDPITASIKQRKDAGSVASVLNTKKDQFWFSMKLEGDGCVIKMKAGHKKNASSLGGSPKLKNSPSRAPGESKDPISASIKQRKEGGSVLTIVKPEFYIEPFEPVVFTLKGTGCKPGGKKSVVAK